MVSGHMSSTFQPFRSGWNKWHPCVGSEFRSNAYKEGVRLSLFDEQTKKRADIPNFFMDKLWQD